MKPRILMAFAIALGGCAGRSTPTVPPRSPFSTHCDLRAIVLTSVPGPDREAMWGTHGVDTRFSGGPGRLEDQNDFHGSFFYQTKDGRKVECKPEDVDRFLRLIKAAIEAAARADGARLFDVKDDLRGSLVRGFQMKYEAGDARGTIEAEIEPEPTSAGLTVLHVEIHEVVESR